jgi:hypothetical protein
MISIVIASILKPVDEVRIYKRFAISLSKTNKYDLNIIGIESKSHQSDHPNIHFHSYKYSHRSIINRFRRWIEYTKKIKEIDPELIIITSPEFLLIHLLFIKKNSQKWVYDIQEDYWKNITFLSTYPKTIKFILRSIIRKTEAKLASNYDGLILAEKAYLNELPFAKKHQQKVILENKYHNSNPIKRAKKKEAKNLIFTGVVSDYSGIFETISLFRKLQETRPHLTLKIVGYSFQHKTQKRLKKLISTNNQIEWIGEETFVSHDKIISELRNSDVAIIGYRPNSVNENKMPSKLYEYVAESIPFIVQKETIWCQYGTSHNMAICIDFDAIEPHGILSLADRCIENPIAHDIEGALWQTEENRLIELINTLIKYT